MTYGEYNEFKTVEEEDKFWKQEFLNDEIHYMEIREHNIKFLKRLRYVVFIVLFASAGLILETKFSKYKNPAIEQFYQDGRY